MHHARAVSLLLTAVWLPWAAPVSGDPSFDHSPRRGVHLPIYRRHGTGSSLTRRATAAAALGDYQDVSYNVLVKLGNVEIPLLLDTGSSDMWAISDTCTKNCSGGLPMYPHKSLKYAGVDARLFYGDSATGTFAFGPIGKDTVTMAGLNITNQYFAAINQTDTTIVATRSSGILGLGFPVNSVIWNALFKYQFPTVTTTTSVVSSTASATSSSSKPQSTGVSRRASSPVTGRGILRGPLVDLVDFGDIQSLATVDQLLGTFITNGPLVARMAFSRQLTDPSFTITLQRDSVDVGGNVGLLSLGELPSGVSNKSLTWVPVRTYTADQGGIPASAAAPKEVYPISWEVPLDNVYLDGKVLPQSTLSTGVTLTALIDTGSSLIRGPRDVVAQIFKTISGDQTLNSYDCSVPHTLEFQIGGKRFPVDPRDFGWQAQPNSVKTCNSSIAATDPPSKGFLYAWSLGDPFLKSVLASFHYGNLTHPSTDLPRIGFVSTVPEDATDLLKTAVQKAGNNFPAIIEPPRNSTVAATETGIAGVLLAPTGPLPGTISTASSTTTITGTDSAISQSSRATPPASSSSPPPPPSNGVMGSARPSGALAGAALAILLAMR